MSCISINSKNLKFSKLAVTFLLIFSNGVFAGFLWKFLEYPWKRLDPYAMDFADGIVVLSIGRKSPPGNKDIIEWNDPDRFLAGLELYKAKRSNKLFFTGGVNPYDKELPLEGDIYRKEAISLGVPDQNIFTTKTVFNTFQEAKAIKELLNLNRSKKSNKLILVTSAYHMKRAKKVFEREGIFVQPYPVDFKSNKSYKSLFKNPLNWIPNARSLSLTSEAIREVIGRIIYRSI